MCVVTYLMDANQISELLHNSLCQFLEDLHRILSPSNLILSQMRQQLINERCHCFLQENTNVIRIRIEMQHTSYKLYKIIQIGIEQRGNA